MPPRKRAGRKATPKSKNSPAPPPPAVDEAPATPTPSSAAADFESPALEPPAPSFAETPLSEISVSDATPEPLAQALVAPTDVSPPPPSETLVDAALNTTPEPPEVAAAAPDVTPAMEPESRADGPYGETSELASEGTPPAEELSQEAPGKSTTRVRKVIKKKIIKKRIVKVASLAENEEEKLVVEEAAPAAEIANRQQVEIADTQLAQTTALEEETPAPVPQTEFGNPSADAAFGSDETAPQNAMETDDVDSEAKKDVLAEQDKVEEEAPTEPVIPEDDEVDKVEEEAPTEPVILPHEVDKVEEEAPTEPVIHEDDEVDKVEEEAPTEPVIPEDDEVGISERQKRRKTEIFIGGLDRDATEEDLRKVFMTVGEIVEIRIMMDGKTGKNKGYAFLRYKESTQAKKAVSEFSKVEICGKLCGAAALEGNDTIFLGNIDKKWKKEDVVKLLEEIGIEKIDTVTVMVDPNNAEMNRGFAFLELESNRDAQIAYKKLQKKDAFGKGRNIKVAWAEPLNDPDEEEMQKVKSVYVEGIPASWDEAKVRKTFERFGEIERVVLARNMPSAKRKDFAFVNYTSREAALSCIESFEMEDLTDNGLKINVKVSLAKPLRRGKHNTGASKSNSIGKDKHKTAQRETKSTFSDKGKHLKGGPMFGGGNMKPSMFNEYLHGFREQAAWRQGPVGYTRGPSVPDYSHAMAGEKRAFSALGEDGGYSDLRGYPRPRFESSFPVAGSSYSAFSPGMPGSSQPYYQRPDVGYPSASHSQGGHPGTLQRQGYPPYRGSSTYPRY